MTATLDHPSSEATTLTVTVTAGANAVTADFTLSANTTLTIAAGETSSTGTVTIEAVDNSADHANKEVTVSAGAANTQGCERDPSRRDTDPSPTTRRGPTVTLILSADFDSPRTTDQAR